MRNLFKALIRSLPAEPGQTLAEYSLIIAFVAVGAIALVAALAGIILGYFSDLTAAF